MVHGNPTWSFYYRKLISAFSDKYRVIVPDHIGCGLSDKPQKYGYTIDENIKPSVGGLLSSGILFVGKTVLALALNFHRTKGMMGAIKRRVQQLVS